MHLHFIAIGGSAMHNLAIALSRKGYAVTGSDDEILDPSRSRLFKEGILPDEIGWFVDKITPSIDAVILGMHARADNPELLAAKEMNIPVYSYPEYLYEASKEKIRVVIGGSHGKTTITSMLLHALQKLNVEVDYMVGAQLEGYDCMVRLTSTAQYMVIEGDEYLSSPIDRRPKFHLYHPHIALLSGIAWDHINVFPTFSNYIEQFDVFIDKISSGGALIYNESDLEVLTLAQKHEQKIKCIPYGLPDHDVTDFGTLVRLNGKEYPLEIFGDHNLQNLMGAMNLAEQMGIDNHSFLTAMSGFKGAGKRLQKIIETNDFVMYKDFAHSPSKLTATTKAVKKQYPNHKVIACMELHTFSSLKKEFLPLYKGSMDAADVALVYFNLSVVEHKKLETIDVAIVQNAFEGNVVVVNNTAEVLSFIHAEIKKPCVLLMMSSGNFDGIDFEALGAELA